MVPAYLKAQAALARAARQATIVSSSDPDSSESDNCHWDGTEGDKVPQFFEPFIHHGVPDPGSDTEWQCEDGPLPSDDESSESDEDLVGQNLLRSFALAGNNDDASIATAYEAIIEYKSKKDWKAAEKKLNDPYTGGSERTQRRKDKKLRDKEELDMISRDSASAAAFKKMFVVLPRTVISNTPVVSVPDSAVPATTPAHTSLPVREIVSPAPQINATAVSAPAGEIFTGYISDICSGESGDSGKEDPGEAPGVGNTDESIPVQDAETLTSPPSTGSAEEPSYHRVQPVPPLRRTKFAVPQAEHRRIHTAQAAAARANILASALTAIDKVIASKKTVFHAGNASLQSYRARSIQSHLCMVVKNQKLWKLASEAAAEAQGFATKWGGRMVRKWTRNWISDRVIPESKIGKHGKSYSLYDDPIIHAELRSYVRSEKWAMDPEKLVEFSQQKMVPAAADKYLRKITEEEMPAGLKKYMEVELFPRISFKVGRGVSLRTARRLLQREGFLYTEHKKGLYYDGHERPDVVDDRQNRFLPAMAGHRYRLVEYKVGNVEVELDKMYDGKYVLRRLVLAPHDEMTAQCNDGPTKSWVLEGEQPLRKKGVGRGLHRSDVICSTVGYITDAGEELEYGKSYEGYWDGTKFMLKNKIIPAFKAAHGPGYQMLLMVDHSQGH
ncbi:hypothetical protein DFH08DRAFT_970114 [Mycena albidolilacea]|uniref:Uncharacterized protein n=1 Tax=Mycena albidolilacea TaxID=1033008 RepID=A0AAD6ZH08_9AGAR|nr:hypothetical protein DFH08DRAFT_970114 [Mycena albidolilacea]